MTTTQPSTQFDYKALVDEAVSGSSSDTYLRACWYRLLRRAYGSQLAMGEPKESCAGFAYLMALDTLNTFRPRDKAAARQDAIGRLWSYGSKAVASRGWREFERIQRQEPAELMFDLESPESPDTERVDSEDSRQDFLQRARSVLSRREARILLQKARGRTLREIAAKEGVSFERIRQILQSAIAKLQRLVASHDHIQPSDLGIDTLAPR